MTEVFTPEHVQNFFWTFVGGTALVLALRFVLVRSLNEIFRQDVFELRRELFLWMADGNIAAGDPAYLHTRNTMNALLRFTERTSVLRALLSNWVLKDEVKAYEAWKKATIENIPGEARKDLLEIRRKLDAAVLRHLLRTSATLILARIIVVVLAGAVMLVRIVFRRPPPTDLRDQVQQLTREMPSTVEAEAMATEGPMAAAA